MEIKVQIDSVRSVLKAHGVSNNGDVQKFLTDTIDRRIGKYMPHLTGYLETKAKRVTSPSEITVAAPYARYTYFGKVMEGYPPKHVTNRKLNYTKTFNPMAGPFWDRRLMAAERKAIEKEVTDYANRTR